MLSTTSVLFLSETCERHSDHEPRCQPQLGGCVTVSGHGSMVLGALPEHIAEDSWTEMFSASAHHTARYRNNSCSERAHVRPGPHVPHSSATMTACFCCSFGVVSRARNGVSTAKVLESFETKADGSSFIAETALSTLAAEEEPSSEDSLSPVRMT